MAVVEFLYVLCVVLLSLYGFNSLMLAAAPWLMIVAVGPPLLYIVAQVAEGERWRYRLWALPLLVLLGMGLALSNTKAVLQAVLGLHQGFQRTPKFALRQRGDTWVGSVYALSGDSLVWGELGLAVFALALLAAPGVNCGFAFWLLLYAGGFGYVASVSLRQAHQRRRWLAMQTRSATSKVERIPQGGPGRDR
jgi:hypothetical protein